MKKMTIAGLIVCAGTAAMANPDNDAAPKRAMKGSPVVNPAPEALGDTIGNATLLDALFNPLSNGVLGVEFAWGHYWISGRNLTAGAPHLIIKLRPDGTFVAQYNQVVSQGASGPTTSAWGGRDGASNEAANKLYFGHELGNLAEYDYDPITGNLTGGRTYTISGITGSIRALARHPQTGNFFTADFSTPIREFTIAGGVVNTYANNQGPGGTTLAYYGLAFDHDDLDANEKLWGWSQNVGAVPDVIQRLTEMNDASGGIITRTGREAQINVVAPGTTPAPTTQAIAGGMDIVCINGKVAASAVTQATPSDYLWHYDLDGTCGTACYADCDTSTGVGVLDIFDFLCFQNRYASALPYACNCDTSTGNNVCDIFDFLCFQNAFAGGCP